MSANGLTFTSVQIRCYSVPKRLVDNGELFVMPNTWLYGIEGVFFFLTYRGFLFRFVAQRNKMRHNEMRPCHVTQGCVHTVKKIMERFWYRVGQCKMGNSGLPGKLPIMPEKETPSDEE